MVAFRANCSPSFSAKSRLASVLSGVRIAILWAEEDGGKVERKKEKGNIRNTGAKTNGSFCLLPFILCLFTLVFVIKLSDFIF